MLSVRFLVLFTALAAAMAEDFLHAVEASQRQNVRNRLLKTKADSKKGDTPQSAPDPTVGSNYNAVTGAVPTPSPVTVVETITPSPVTTVAENITGQQGGAGGGQDQDRTVGIGTDTIAQQNWDGIVFDDGKTLTYAGVWEHFPCESFEDSAVLQEKAANPLSDFQCQTNSCPNGCCREFGSYLLCDEDNNYPQRQCACNENTFVHSSQQIQSAPTMASTMAPANPRDRLWDTNFNSAPANTTDTDTDPTSSPSDESGQLDPPPQYPDPDYCFPHFSGQDWGIHPTDTSNLPAGMAPGDCTSNSHCQPTSLDSGEAVCCLKHLCICRLFNSIDDCRQD